MPLIDELQITLKDFLPDRSDATIIRDGRGVIAMVSDRLFTALTTYAADHRLRFNSVVAQLHAEVHGKTAAKIAPARTGRHAVAKPSKGDR